MIPLDFTPSIIRWIYSAGSTVMFIAVAQADTHIIKIFDSTSSVATPTTVLDQIHNSKSTVTALCFCPALKMVCSTDTQGMIEFWKSESPHR